MLSLQVCFWVSLASCLSSLYSYWAFSFILERFLNTESQWITKPPSSYTQSRTWLWIEGKPLIRATIVRAKKKKKKWPAANTIASERGRHHSPAMTICGLPLLPWTQVCVCPSCSCVCREPGPLVWGWKQTEVTHHSKSQKQGFVYICSTQHNDPEKGMPKSNYFWSDPLRKDIVHQTNQQQGQCSEMECDQQHTRACVPDHNSPNFDLSCNRKDFLWNLFHVQ